MLLGDVVMILIPVLILLLVIAAVGATVYVLLRLRTGERVSIPLGFLLRLYLYLASLISLLVFVVSLSALLNVGFSHLYGRDFSYNAPSVYRPADPLEAKPSQQTLEEQRTQRERELARNYREGLLNGTVGAALGGLFFVAHWIGRRVLESEEERRGGFLNRTYIFLLLAIFGIGTILALPSALVSSLNFILVPPEDTEFYRQPPGPALATGLLFVPFWLFYLVTVLRQARRKET